MWRFSYDGQHLPADARVWDAACRDGDMEACGSLAGWFGVRRSHEDTAVGILKHCCAGGNAECCYRLGRHYERKGGKWVGDTAQQRALGKAAIARYRLACAGGSWKACERLGAGLGASEDLDDQEEAAEAFAKALAHPETACEDAAMGCWHRSSVITTLTHSKLKGNILGKSLKEWKQEGTEAERAAAAGFMHGCRDEENPQHCMRLGVLMEERLQYAESKIAAREAEDLLLEAYDRGCSHRDPKSCTALGVFLYPLQAAVIEQKASVWQGTPLASADMTAQARPDSGPRDAAAAARREEALWFYRRACKLAPGECGMLGQVYLQEGDRMRAYRYLYRACHAGDHQPSCTILAANYSPKERM